MSVNTDPITLDELRLETSALMAEWFRVLAPHFGSSGSMDLDLIDWPDAEGPSFYNQFASYALLLLSQGDVPGLKDSERESCRALALKNIAYCLSITDHEFRTPHYSRGRDWGAHTGEWMIYYLLCALELVERDGLGTVEMRARLRIVVQGGTDVLHRHFLQRYAKPPTHFPGNHETWHGLLFYRAGNYFSQSEWSRYGHDFIVNWVLPYQSADGYWPEGQGIVVGYSCVTAHAVSIFAELAGNEAAHRAVEKAIGFHGYFKLPDGSDAITPDVLMRYHKKPVAFFPPGFIHSPKGQELAMLGMRSMRGYLQEYGVNDNGAQQVAFLASSCEWLFRSDVVVENKQPDVSGTLPVAKVQDEKWVGFASWQIVPEWTANRFVLDSQNFIELWHAEAGYLVGTGNSKFMPRFSTLRRVDQGRAYVPDRARGQQTGPQSAVVCYGFGEDEVEVELSLHDGACEVAVQTTKCSSHAHYEFALMLAFQPGETIAINGREETLSPSRLVRSEQSFQWRGLNWGASADSVLEYPIVPHNCYTKDGLPHPSDYVARWSVNVTLEKCVLRIQPASNSAATP